MVVVVDDVIVGSMFLVAVAVAAVVVATNVEVAVDVVGQQLFIRREKTRPRLWRIYGVRT